jgi:hypothetical protein
MMVNSELIISFMALGVLMLSTKPAYAYLDPGTGSMVVQALIATVAAVSVTIGIFWHRLKSFFGRMFGREKGGGHSSDDA